MSVKSIPSPFNLFSGTDGKALDNGFVFIGEENKDPEINPITVFWDAAITQPAVQPIRTINGFLSRSGSPARIYTGAAYSITVKDKQSNIVFTSLSDNVFTDASVVPFLTVAAMVDDPGLIVGQLVETAEYFSGTGGGNRYLIVAAATGTADGGSFIDVTGPATAVQAQALWYNDKKDVYQYGALGDDSTLDHTAIQAALDAHPDIHFPSGNYSTSVVLSIVGSGREITFASDAAIRWRGLTTDVAVKFGDGGTTSTQFVNVHGMKVHDITTNTDKLVVLDTASRCSFYDCFLTGVGVHTSGVGLFMQNSIINSFYRMRTTNFWDGVHLGTTSNAIEFFGLASESNANDGLVIPAGVSVAKVNLYGGTFEENTGFGINVLSPPQAFNMDGVYFETNSVASINLLDASATVRVIGISNCRFVSVNSSNAHIVHNGAFRVLATNNSYGSENLISMVHASAKYVGINNHNRDAFVEITPGSNTKHATIGMSLDGALHNDFGETRWVWESGNTASRPAAALGFQQFFDTTLGKPIWKFGVNWVDATGTTV